MTALEDTVEDIKKLSRDWEDAERGTGRTVSLENVVRALNQLRERIQSFHQHVLNLYKAAELLTASFSSAGLAATAWESLRNDYASVSARFEKLPKIEPEIDKVIGEMRNTLRDLVEKSDKEYRSYIETAHLLASHANEKRLEQAVKDASEGKVTRWKNVAELIKSKRG